MQHGLNTIVIPLPVLLQLFIIISIHLSRWTVPQSSNATSMGACVQPPKVVNETLSLHAHDNFIQHSVLNIFLVTYQQTEDSSFYYYYCICIPLFLQGAQVGLHGTSDNCPPPLCCRRRLLSSLQLYEVD